MKEKKYGLTYAACVAGSVNQATIANVTAVLFVSFIDLYGFGIWQLGLLVGVNFAVQLMADVVLSLVIDKVSHRKLVITACTLAAAGLVAYGTLPLFFEGAWAVYGCMIFATVLFSFAGGMLEVMVSPITEAIPKKSNGRAMSLMHSCYAFGQVLVVGVTAIYLLTVGADKWQYIVLALAALPVLDMILFAICPLETLKSTPPPVEEKKKSRFSPYVFLLMAAIFTGGGAETMMNQYVSTLAKVALGFSEFVANMVGMCMFAATLGIGRLITGLLGDRINMNAVLIAGSALSAACFLTAGLVPVPAVALAACVVCGLATSPLWPGTLVVAGKDLPGLGAWIFAILAMSGDLGDSILPAVSGALADPLGVAPMFAIMAAVPALCCVCHSIIAVKSRKRGMEPLLNKPNGGK